MPRIVKKTDFNRMFTLFRLDARVKVEISVKGGMQWLQCIILSKSIENMGKMLLA